MKNNNLKGKCLAETHPEIAAQWDWENNEGILNKNGEQITPYNITAGCHQNVNWRLDYIVPMDDPFPWRRGKHYEFLWNATPNSRTSMNLGCPFLSGQKVLQGYNDLASTHPEIATQFDWVRNKGILNKDGEQITPYNITIHFSKKINWKLDYDVPMDDLYPWRRGKHYEFAWSVSPNSRSIKNSGCPFLSGGKVQQGYNDLASTHPEIATQFDWVKNKGILNKNGKQITPYNINAGSEQNVNWILHYDVPKDDPYSWRRGKHYDFTWNATVSSRTSRDIGCPFLSGRKVWQGYNDLASTHPEIAAQFDWVRNIGVLNKDSEQITPYNITAGCHYNVNWILHYDVPMDDPYPWRRGKHYDFTWNTTPNSRTSKNNDCPYLAKTNAKVWQGYNDLASTHPELTAQFDWVRNTGVLSKDGEQITPYNITAGCTQNINWRLDYDAPMDDPYPWRRGKHYDFIWNASPNSRTSQNQGCPFLSGQKVLQGYNDLASTHPEIAAQFDWVRNTGVLNKDGEQITPYNISAKSAKKIWWIYTLPNGKCISWSSVTYLRTSSVYKCPELAKHLQTSFPEQAIYYYIKQIYPDAINSYKDIFTHGKSLDIYIPSLKIGIEYDGEAWHKGEDMFERDLRKYAICVEHNITLIRIKENKNHNGDNMCDICLHTKKNLNATIEQLRKYIELPTVINTDKDSEKIKAQYLFVA